MWRKVRRTELYQKRRRQNRTSISIQTKKNRGDRKRSIQTGERHIKTAPASFQAETGGKDHCFHRASSIKLLPHAEKVIAFTEQAPLNLSPTEKGHCFHRASSFKPLAHAEKVTVFTEQTPLNLSLTQKRSLFYNTIKTLLRGVNDCTRIFLVVPSTLITHSLQS